jgi:hypothetical protein
VSLAVAIALIFLTVDTPTAAPADRAYWLVGNWHCQSRAGSKAARTYSKVLNDGSINMTNTVRLPSDFYVIIRERYQYDPKSDSWTVDSPRSPIWGAMHATADPWLGKDWVFLGKSELPGPYNRLTSEQPVRMVYTFLDDNSFHRNHQQKIAQLWQTYSEETCTRDPVPRPRPST